MMADAFSRCIVFSTQSAMILDSGTTAIRVFFCSSLCLFTTQEWSSSGRVMFSFLWVLTFTLSHQ